MALIMDGRKIAYMARQSLIRKIQTLSKEQSLVPHLAIIVVGNNLTSQAYVRHKVKACQEIGVKATLFKEAASISEAAMLAIVQRLNADPLVHGIIVQLPLPIPINPWLITQAIDPLKDVDGLHANNYGRMAYNQPTHIPATPLGILMLLAHHQIRAADKHCVVVGRGHTVGTPLSIILSRNNYFGNGTVTLCHSYTKNLASFTRQADILIVAAGKPGLIEPSMVKSGAAVIDVGLTQVADHTKKLGYRLQGDVDFENVVPRCSYITPVPGGVGPMTIVALLANTFRAATHQVYTSAGTLEAIIGLNPYY
jgi:methylenetetrahydrofolate dehydrogenase (NADP+)/methenyltetrahydrofolate cyclohydrolase